MKNVLNFVSVFPCPSCGGSGYTVTQEIAGLNSLMSFKCDKRLKRDCGIVYQLHPQPEGESVNTRFQMAMFSIGRNRQQAVWLLREMNMHAPPVSSTMWNKTKTKIHKASQAVAEETMHRAASELSDGTGGSRAVTESCDGSWQRRGFQSKNSVATVLSVNPNGPVKVVDVQQLLQHVSSAEE